MIDSIKRMSLDLHSTTSNESVRVKRSDTGRKICISLVDGGLPYTISDGCYAYFTAKKPDGNILKNRCSIENNTVIYRLTEQTTSVVGRVDSEIKLYGADGRCITSSKFTICVYDTVYSTGDNTQPDKTDPILQSKSVTPSAKNQVVVPDTNYDGLSQVTVAGDADLIAGNIKKGVSIFNVTGTYENEPSLQNKSVTPSAKNQVIVPDTNYDGLAQVTVDGDADLVASNIKKGVAIFGVAGTYEASGGITLPTLTNPGTADDLAEDKQFIDANGNVVTGTVPTKDIVAQTNVDSVMFDSQSGKISVVGKLGEKAIVSGAASIFTNVPAGEFGDASASDVAKGKTFTSVNGLKATGTHECEGGITPTGTKTITTNGTYDVTSYAYAQVNVPTTGGDVVYGEDIEVGSLSELHSWNKYIASGTTTRTPRTKVLLGTTSAGGSITITYADEVDTSSGQLGLSADGYDTVVISETDHAGVLKGKAVRAVGKYYEIPKTANVYLDGSDIEGTFRNLYASEATEVTYTSGGDSFVCIVVSEDSNAYPQNGTQDGYKYVYNGTLDGSGGAVLPTLTNPGTAGDLAEGKQLIGASGNVVTGTNTFRDIKSITIEEV